MKSNFYFAYETVCLILPFLLEFASAVNSPIKAKIYATTINIILPIANIYFYLFFSSKIFLFLTLTFIIIISIQINVL